MSRGTPPEISEERCVERLCNRILYLGSAANGWRLRNTGVMSRRNPKKSRWAVGMGPPRSPMRCFTGMLKGYERRIEGVIGAASNDVHRALAVTRRGALVGSKKNPIGLGDIPETGVYEQQHATMSPTRTAARSRDRQNSNRNSGGHSGCDRDQGDVGKTSR